jgi:RimJ/RimL family protein N-acetyltransferase
MTLAHRISQTSFISSKYNWAVYPLLTKRLSIEPLATKDVLTFVGYRQDSEIARFQGWETSYSHEQAINLLESQAGVELPERGQWLQLAIHNRITGELIGDLAVHRTTAPDKSYEIGFTIARKNHGMGFAQESANRLISFLFMEVMADKLIAHTDRRNNPAIKLLSKLGFNQIFSNSWQEEFKGEFVTVDYFEKCKDFHS